MWRATAPDAIAAASPSIRRLQYPYTHCGEQYQNNMCHTRPELQKRVSLRAKALCAIFEDSSDLNNEEKHDHLLSNGLEEGLLLTKSKEFYPAL